MNKRWCELPRRFAVRFEYARNPVAQLHHDRIREEFEIVPFSRGKHQGERLTAAAASYVVLPRKAKFEQPPSEPTLLTSNGLAPGDAAALSSWVPGIGYLSEYDKDRLDGICDAVRRSWDGDFHFIEEGVRPDGRPRDGLRPPQVGGLHSAIGHWKMSEEPATIVMPTGTGKTETMVALTVHERPHRVLVIVPSDILRSQITEKFLNLGLLKRFGVAGMNALYPIVGTFKHGLGSPEGLRGFLECCNVVVSTMSLLSRLSEAEQAVCAECCSHLFVDEAHHIKAWTWERFRAAFSARRVLQFTATPFRNDGQHVDGRVVFN